MYQECDLSDPKGVDARLHPREARKSTFMASFFKWIRTHLTSLVVKLVISVFEKVLLLCTIFPSFCGPYLRWLWPGSGVDRWVWLWHEAILALEEKSPAPNAAGADAFRWCPCSGLPIPVEAQNWSTSRSSSLGKLKNKTTTEIDRRQIEKIWCHLWK